MINYEKRKVRSRQYEDSVDENMRINPFYFHLACVNWQGSAKDLLINADIYSMYFYRKSIFDEIIRYVFNRPFYMGEIKNLYANCKLNKDVYGDDYYYVTSKKDIMDCSDGCLYLHDTELYFKNIGMDMRKESGGGLIQFINNKRKDKIFLRFSLHRFMSIHVRVRELIPMWIVPDIWLESGSEACYMKNYYAKYKVYNCNGKKICCSVLNDLYRFAKLYDTEEKAMPLIE